MPNGESALSSSVPAFSRYTGTKIGRESQIRSRFRFAQLSPAGSTWRDNGNRDNRDNRWILQRRIPSVLAVFHSISSGTVALRGLPLNRIGRVDGDPRRSRTDLPHEASRWHERRLDAPRHVRSSRNPPEIRSIRVHASASWSEKTPRVTTTTTTTMTSFASDDRTNRG